ncbi:hypothetical protein HL666_17050 [Bradyrhizobium sp. 83002]|nr:hypothetical protein [Bradyrhizobium aeschynomenes]NPU12482.1 hypothetical protein [Bradyrhizobium aeschynomenes]
MTTTINGVPPVYPLPFSRNSGLWVWIPGSFALLQNGFAILRANAPE